ncbi:hypothetical protein [Chryseobacterium sp. FH2]|nr:hypothetical protein [Chryseobacterium sp. FH2]
MKQEIKNTNDEKKLFGISCHLKICIKDKKNLISGETKIFVSK